jgi:hypothetical protein
VTNLLVGAGDWWRYLDNGVDPGPGWRLPGFDDRAWPGGFAELGYGDFDEETTLGYGTNPAAKHITYYFRKDFTVVGAESYGSLALQVVRDDGVVVYVNGVEVWRNNLPAGAIGRQTLALTNVTRDGEAQFLAASIPPSVLVEGRNVVAAEVHQVSPENQDISFDLEMTGVSLPPAVTRGPYLQRGGGTNVTVRWRTSTPASSVVRYGLAPGALTWTHAAGGPATTEHEVPLQGLQPDTRYYYSIGTLGFELAGDETHFFVTAPTAARPTRVWVIGDAGTANASQRAVYEAYRNLTGDRHTDVWLMLGDNAYNIGTDLEYQRALFEMYPELLRQTVAWSTIGNHEVYSGSFLDFPFLGLFTQPVAGECGGLASGTERYFSWDYGNIHFVCLDSMTSDRSPDGPMAQWLQADLLANTREWTIAFWHHPPYTRGSHNSDWEAELIEMRANIGPILEAHGVDLVLGGHSHSYERSYLMRGHFGPSSTFTPEMQVDSGDGREAGVGPYRKPVTGPQANEGTVYIVAGCAGKTSGGLLNHPAMYFGANQLGSLVLDISGPRLDARFLRDNGVVSDTFTILKGEVAPRLSGVEVSGTAVTLRWLSQAGRTYRVERSTTLAAGSWAALSGPIAGTGALLTWSSAEAAIPAGAFFRIQESVE